MKKIILSLLFFLLIFASASAQLYVEGDHNKDGKMSVTDLTILTDILIGKRASQTPEMLIAGTWRSKEGEVITLCADGTTDYAGAKTFKYNNIEKTIVFYDSSSRVVKLFNVEDVNFGFLNLNIPGESTNTIYYNSVFFASSITLTDTQLNLSSGSTHQLIATLAPISAFNTSCTWSSSNPSVATVSNTGLVTAKGSGSAIIFAIASDGTGVSADCSVTVIQLVESITLSQTTLSLDIDSYIKLTATIIPSSVSNTSLTWSSSDESVAEVTNKGIVSVNGYGKCTITCTANDGSGVSATCTVVVEKPHEYVDLGLPSGLKWATCNLGAENPEDYGYYYAWGATEPQDVYDWVHCPFQSQNTTDWSSIKYTKYLGSTSSSYKDPSATDANALKTVLDPEDDAAHVNWGGDWRMPTEEEQDELLENCYWKWVTSYNGKSVNGYIVYKVKDSADKGKRTNNNSSYSPVGSYSVSDPHLFLPAAGARYDSSLYNAGSRGYCWSSSLASSNPDFAYALSFDSDNVYWCYLDRPCGQSVRPVCQ